MHGLGLTHIDALSHMFVRGEMYNGRPPSDVRSTGAQRNTVMTLSDGLVGRGVLLDIPAVRGVEFARPGDGHRGRRSGGGRGGRRVSRSAPATSCSCRPVATLGVAPPEAGSTRSAAVWPAWIPTCLPWLQDRARRGAR